MQYIITLQSNGRWYGRIPESDDGYGNEIDCLFYNPREALSSLIEQMSENRDKPKNRKLFYT